MASEQRLTLALDQNFPEPILRRLDEFLVDVHLVPLRQIDARLPELPRVKRQTDPLPDFSPESAWRPAQLRSPVRLFDPQSRFAGPA